MKPWLLIPVKPFGEGKSRLAGTLSADQRANLSRQLLDRLLSLATESAHFAGILVISRDQQVLDLAATRGATTVAEPGTGLNAALVAGRTVAIEQGADSILILPSDLPWVTTTDLDRLVEAAEGGAAIVLAPSHDGGTNALLLHPPDAIDFVYGTESYQHHHDLAQRANLHTVVVDSPTLAFDVDSPADLRLLTPG